MNTIPPGKQLKTISKFTPSPNVLKKTGTVAVVGLGYVGLPLALLARERNFKVIGIDIDGRKRQQIQSGSVPDIHKHYGEELRKNPLEVHGTFGKIAESDIVVICVPTPVDKNHEPDLEPVKSACESVSEYMHPNQLIILESTVNPGTAEEVLIPIMEKNSGLVAGKDFGVAHCPERINPGDPNWSVEKIPRVVGATTPAALAEAADFYRSILSAPVKEMATIREAEAVKMVENCFRDVNIAFVNELAMSFTKLGIDVINVLDGANTKPFSFMRHEPGCGVGGHCIPVDPYYLIRYARKNGFSHDFLSLARSINNQMPVFAIGLLREELHKKGRRIGSSKIALLGLSYKSDVSDLRESPALEIRERLLKEGAEVRTFDPFSLELSTAKSIREALADADAAFIATAHKEFRELKPSEFKKNKVGIVIDGRNCLPKESFIASGIAYRGIGR